MYVPEKSPASRVRVGSLPRRYSRRYDALSMATDFVIRDWRLDPYDGDQAPTHIHHAGEEAFVCLEGDLSVTLEGAPRPVPPGSYIVVPRGTPHTFAS